jgi:NADH dehydrogenase FAD-containing subunit
MSIQTDVLIIGGGFAGVSAAQALEKKGFKTLLIDKKDYFEVTFATLRDIADPQQTKNKARKHYTNFLTGLFMQGSITTLSETTAQLANGEEIQFEQAIIASGTRYPSMPVAKSDNAMDLSSRNNELMGYHQQLKSAKKILIIGGGVVGVELAGEIAFSMPNAEVLLAHSRDALLDGYKEKAQRKSLQQLEDLGVTVSFNTRFKKSDDQYIDTNSGTISDADLVFEATGVIPNNEFLTSQLPHILNARGFVKVNEKLEVSGYTHLYALGDIADVGEAKLGYLAQQQGNYVAQTIIKKRNGKTNKGYKRNPLMALIPVGQKYGVVQLPFAVTTLKMLVNMKQKDLFISKMYKSFGTNPN